MADGSPEDRTGPKQMNDLTFSAPGPRHGDTNKCNGETFNGDTVKLSFYADLKTSDSCEKSDTSGVAANCSAATVTTNSRKSHEADIEDGDDRKKRCFDRYDSSESSDSGVAVLSPTESGGCSGSDITEPGSPRSPESLCSTAEESTGAGARMPPWASEPAPPGPRRIAVQPAPVRRAAPHPHRRITEYFNHKMKPQNGLKRDSAAINHEDTKKKCLPKNGVTHELEKYISYLSQTLSPKVLMDVGKQAEEPAKKQTNPNGAVDCSKLADLCKTTSNTSLNGMIALSRQKEGNGKSHKNMNGFVEVRHSVESYQETKEKTSGEIINGLMKTSPTSDPSANRTITGGIMNGLIDGKHGVETTLTLESSNTAVTSGSIKGLVDERIKDSISSDPSVNCSKQKPGASKRADLTGVRIAPATSASNATESVGVKIAPATSASSSPKKSTSFKSDIRVNGIVSSTTKLDSMNGVVWGSNNISLNSVSSKSTNIKKELVKRTTPQIKRTNRKSSACIANSKNLTWSKVNNLKQVQLQKQKCVNSTQSPQTTCTSGEANTAPKMNIPNGVRQVPMAMNGGLSNLNVPVTSLQNCHPLNITQPCNGTVPPNNLASFVAVPQNVMLTTLRIPQNGIPAQTITQPNNMTAFNRPNVNVSSPSKLNGQFVFPLVQNINGTVVQIPNLMAKMPNFVLPQTPSLAQTQQELQNTIQNQQAAQILFNGTLLKLANTLNSSYSNVNKNMPVTSQPLPVMNKNVQGMQPVGMTVQPKPNYTVNFSHPVLMPQPGFIVTSVPNINVKETWSYTNTNASSSTQTPCSNPIVHHPPPMVPNFTTQGLHTSSIPIVPVKPPDNPIQGTDPPSSTVSEPNEVHEVTSTKCDIPWLSKTVNNNIVPLDSKIPSRPFAQVSYSDKFDEFVLDRVNQSKSVGKITENTTIKDTSEDESRKVEVVARREETIFTQITVLKDVSSSVQSTVIEANFCNATTESSESGIGTDKSIDSPSDSQTSKDCDDDSSLSLSVSVCSVEVQSSQKSPILKQPKILRFPPRSVVKTESGKRTSSSDTTSTVTVCMWENCKKEFQSDTDLLGHLQSVHVETQAGKDNFVCLWERCKVRGKPSCSKLWLERHTLSHGGNKPFKCIVDGCERRFSTQILLERHVNNHFNEVSPNTSGSKKTAESGSKLIRRNGKKLRYRRQPWSARMFDFFDAGMMEGLAWRLARCTRWRLGGTCPLREPAGRHTLTLRAALAATRYNHTEARTEALLTYYPPHVVEDEWVPEKEVKRIKRVEIADLPVHTKVILYESFCASYRHVPPPPRAPPPPPRRRTARHCASSRMLNNLLAKNPSRESCMPALPIVFREDDGPKVSGAKKRKMGRRHGGDCFWPSGR